MELAYRMLNRQISWIAANVVIPRLQADTIAAEHHQVTPPPQGNRKQRRKQRAKESR